MSRPKLPPEMMDDLVEGSVPADDPTWAVVVSHPDASDAWVRATTRRETADAHARLVHRFPWLSRVFLLTRRARRKMTAVPLALPTTRLDVAPRPVLGLLSTAGRRPLAIAVDWSRSEAIVEVQVGDVVRFDAPNGASVWYHSEDGGASLLETAWRVEAGEVLVAFTVVAADSSAASNLNAQLARARACTNVVLIVRNPENGAS